MFFSMGDANLGLTYTTQDGKPVCLIYRYNEVVIEVPVSLPPFQFEVHKSKLFYHDTGSGEWWETPKFWGISDNVQEALTDWGTAQLLADIETAHVKTLTMNSLHRLVPKRCQKCSTFSIVPVESRQFEKRFCNFCTKEEKSKFSMGDQDLGIVYENQAGRPVCHIYCNKEIRTTISVVSPTVQFRVEGHQLFFMSPGLDEWQPTDRFWIMEENNAAILSDWEASTLLCKIESKKYGYDLTPVKCMGCNLTAITGRISECSTRQLCSACIAANAVKFTFGDKSLGFAYDNHDGIPVCILYENGNVVAEIPVTAGPIKFEVRDSELFFLSPLVKGWIDTRFFWTFEEKSSKSLTSLENASILARMESLYYNTEMKAYQCKQCNCISIKETCSKHFQRSLCCVCIDQTPREVDNPATEEHKTCTVCMENEIRVSLQPCGHTVLCLKCSSELEREKAPCPICRADITQRIKVFLP
jgi:hypothetical protein